MNGIDLFNPCPLCETKEHLDVTPKDAFDRMVAVYTEAAVCVECRSCRLQLWGHSRFRNLEYVKHRDYETIVNEMAEMWNSLEKKHGDE